MVGDITNSGDVKNIIDSTVTNYGGIDILVSGIFIYQLIKTL